jgi:hypothetical protein
MQNCKPSKYDDVVVVLQCACQDPTTFEEDSVDASTPRLCMNSPFVVVYTISSRRQLTERQKLSIFDNINEL